MSEFTFFLRFTLGSTAPSLLKSLRKSPVLASSTFPTPRVESGDFYVLYMVGNLTWLLYANNLLHLLICTVIHFVWMGSCHACESQRITYRNQLSSSSLRDQGIQFRFQAW